MFSAMLMGSGLSSTLGKVDIFGDSSGIALYQLDGNANDTGGNYDGTATDVTYDTGKFGQCGVFNGTSSYVDSSIAFSGPTSVSFWLKTNDLSTNPFIMESDISGNYMIHLNGPSNYNIRLGLNNIYLDTSNAWTPNVYINCVAIFTNTMLSLYVDGVLLNSSTISTNYSSNSSISFGRRMSGNLYYLTGLIDQVRIFNRALTQSEVTVLYNES